ncbi:MAG TPA: hypothetical protein VIL30_27075 [Ramlibacter sp.]|jgi:hypothetical protein
MNSMFHTSILAATMAIATLQLAGCGGGGGGNDSGSKEPVAWNVAVPSTPLSTQQKSALSSALKQLDAGDASGAITALAQVRSSVAGLNTEVEAGLGLAYATRARSSLTEFQAAAAPVNADIPTAAGGTRQVTVERGAYAAFKSLTAYDPTIAFTLQLVDGEAALDMMVPPGTAVASLPQATQANIGMVATIQFLRLSTKVMQGNSTAVTPAAIDARIAANYDDATRASLNRAARLLTATNTALVKRETDGFLAVLPLAIASALADGNISAAELAVLMKSAITPV